MVRRKLISYVTATLTALLSVISITGSAANTYYDANNDGIINMADAVYIQQFLSGSIKPSNIDTLDFDDNDLVSAMDVSKVQFYNLYGYQGTISSKEAETTVNGSDENYFVFDAQTGARKVYDGYILFDAPESDNSVNSRGIIGDDERWPSWDKNGVVQISHSAGVGSGFVVAPHVIATAAHCVYNSATSSGNSSIKIRLFDTNGVVEHIYDAVETHIPYNYIASVGDGVNKYDYALLTVEEDLSEYMCFELGVALDSASESGKTVLNTGFPTYVNGEYVNMGNTLYTMYSSQGNLLDISDEDVDEHSYDRTRQLFYDNDTTGGNSGGPVYVTESYNGRVYHTIVAIHSSTSETYNYNIGIRITTDLLRFYKYNPNLSW